MRERRLCISIASNRDSIASNLDSTVSSLDSTASSRDSMFVKRVSSFKSAFYVIKTLLNHEGEIVDGYG